MLRLLCVVACLLASAALADVRLPQLEAGAAAYRTKVTAERRSVRATQLLREIKAAAGKPAELVRLHEQLVALNPDNIRSWLQLGTAWREVDPTAEQIAATGYNAYRLSRSGPDQVEALLLIASVRRSQLGKLRTEFEEAGEQIKKSTATLAFLDKPGNVDADLATDKPTGMRETLQTSIERARAASEGALQRIAAIAAELDEIYAEIARRVPGSKFEQMQDGDARSAVFAPVMSKDESKGDMLKISFRTLGSDIKACIDFSQDLVPDGLSYKPVVFVRQGESQVGIGIEIPTARTLCITGLEPGSDYKLDLAQGLPSRAGGRLTERIADQTFKLPDLPQQVVFAGRRLMLPTVGPGEIPIQVTNVDRFDLDLFRVSDRTLYRHLALGHLGGEIPDNEYADLRERFAERYWTGSVAMLPDTVKTNAPTRIGLRVRELLEQRKAWLAQEIRNARGGLGPTASSARQTLSGIADAALTGVTGQFFAGSTPFEAEAVGRPAPGVYALVMSDVAGSGADGSKKVGGYNSCPGTAKPKCDQFVVQWFLETDFGLAFYDGDTGFSVVARSFATGAPKVDALIELVSNGNRVIASGRTDASGVVTFPVNLTRGSGSNGLVAILAHQGDDFGFLPFGKERLDLSRLNVDGRQVPQGFSAFLTSERGIYQPGETVNVLSLLRNTQGVAPDRAPPTVLRIESRDHVLAQEKLGAERWSLGGSQSAFVLPKTSRPGQARISLALGDGENAPVIGEMQIQIGAVRPDRARLDFVQGDTPWAKRSGPGTVDVAGTVTAQYLFGLVGTKQGRLRDAKAEVLVKIGPAGTPRAGCFDEFGFGRFDDKGAIASSRKFLDFVGADGLLKLSLPSLAMPEMARPMAAAIEVTLFDTAGPLASRSRTFPIQDDGGWIGLSKVPRLRPGSRAGTYNLGVDLVSSRDLDDPSGAPLRFGLEREREQYFWQRQGNAWQSTKSVQRDPVSSGEVKGGQLRTFPSGVTGADGRPCSPSYEASELVRDLEIGRYVLTVTDASSGRESAMRFNVGSSATDADQLEPNIFVLSADKPIYRPGEQITLTAEVPFQRGEILVAIADGDVRRWVQGHVEDRRATISVPVAQDWAGKGLYALATAFRAGGDGMAATGLSRAIGAVHVEVRSQESGYGVGIELVGANGSHEPLDRAAIGPDEELKLEICVATRTGCSDTPPAEAYAAVFVVDEGLLSLTGQQDVTPDPERFFYGPRRFGLRLMDNYDRLLLKEGGDRPTRLALSNYTALKVLSEARGPIRLQGGRATVSIPRLEIRNGSAAIYAAIWTKDYAAARMGRVSVRSPIVADLDAPSFLLAGDRAVVPLRLQNVEFAPNSDVRVQVAANGLVKGLALSDDPTRFGPLASSAEIRLPLRIGDPIRTYYLAVETAPGQVGQASIGLTLDPIGTPAALRGARSAWTIDVRSPDLPTVRTVAFPLGREPTDLAGLVRDIVADGYRPETVRIQARFASDPTRLLASTPPQDPDRLVTLDQLVWRGLRLLYDAHGAGAAGQSPGVIQILGDIQGFQQPNGSFNPYRVAGDFAPGESNLVLDDEAEKAGRDGIQRAASVLDFLSLARKARYEIPDRVIRAAASYVASRVKARQEKCDFERVYAVLVLVNHDPARVDRETIAELRKCAAADIFVRSAALAAIVRFGETDDANELLDQMGDAKILNGLNGLDDYWLTMVMELLGEAGAPAPMIQRVSDQLFAADRSRSLSNAAMAWIMKSRLGANPADRNAAGADSRPLAVNVVGAPPGAVKPPQDGVIEMDTIPLARLRNQPVTVAARDGRPVRGSLSIEGIAMRPSDDSRLPVGSLTRRYFDLDTGQSRNLSGNPARLGDRIVVVLEGKASAIGRVFADAENAGSSGTNPLLVADLLPSPFTVMTDDVFGSGIKLTGDLAKLRPRGDLRFVESRSDRWLALVVPESRRTAAKEGRDGEAPATSDRPPTGDPADADVDVRQAYLVRVTMAGRFAVPPLSIEATLPPVRTFGIAAGSMEIGLPLPDAR